jgi:hypothetical protein
MLVYLQKGKISRRNLMKIKNVRTSFKLSTMFSVVISLSNLLDELKRYEKIEIENEEEIELLNNFLDTVERRLYHYFIEKKVEL